MSGRRTVAILSALAGAAVLAAAAAWLLSGDPPPGPRTPGNDGTGGRPTPRRNGGDGPDGEPPSAPGPPVRPRPPVFPEDDTPAPRVPPVPKGAKPWARLRLVDAKTRVPLPSSEGARVTMLVSRGAGRLRIPEPTRRAADGRLEVFAAIDERDDVSSFLAPADLAAARFEVRLPGFERVEAASRGDLEGERDVLLERAEPAVRGVLLPPRGAAKGPVRAEIRAADGSRPPLPLEVPPGPMPSAAGPFEIFDLPEGRWRLDAWMGLPNGDLAHAVRVFDRGAGTADLGEIAFVAPVAIRARVVARDGTWVIDRNLSIRRVGEGGDGLEVGEPDAEGWVKFGGLDPDAEYRVVSSLDGVEEVVHTPSDSSREVRVELRWENQGVRCRLRFTVEGQDPLAWGDIFEGPALEKDAWKRDGFLEHDMAPGEYLFGIWAKPIGKDGSSRRWFAEFTVPDRPLFEATIDMKEGRPR